MKNKIKTKIVFTKMIAVVVLFLFFSHIANASEITSKKVIQLVNQERVSQGVSMLQENPILDEVAGDKLEDMITRNYFAHTSPDGKNPWSWFLKEKYDYQYAGENLAINFQTAEGQMKAWMESETHRKNILNPIFREIGVATKVGTIDGEKSIITVQVFGTPAKGITSQKITPVSQRTETMEEKIKDQVPAVLSVGKNNDAGAGEGKNQKPNVEIPAPLKINGWEKTTQLMELVLVALLVGFSGTLAVFLEKAFISIWEKKLEEDGVKTISAQEYLRILFSEKHSNLKGMKIIKIEPG